MEKGRRGEPARERRSYPRMETTATFVRPPRYADKIDQRAAEWARKPSCGLASTRWTRPRIVDGIPAGRAWSAFLRPSGLRSEGSGRYWLGVVNQERALVRPIQVTAVSRS